MIRYLLEKEFKQFVRNKFLPLLVIFYPILMMVLMPWSADLEVKDLSVSVVDSDHSAASNALVNKVSGSTYFSNTTYAQSYLEAMEHIELQKSDIILEIPQDFEKNLINKVDQQVFIAANAVDGVRGSMSSAYLATIVKEFSRDYGAVAPKIEGIKIITLSKYNPAMDYKLFMVPTLIVILLTIVVGFLPALNIVAEKESGTIEQINVTPVGKYTFIGAKVILYWAIGFTVLTSTLLLAKYMYGIVPMSGFPRFYLLSFLFMLVVSGMGLVISNHSATMQQAIFIMFFFILIMILMSGLFTPVTSMPMWAQVITALNPLKHFTDVMRMLFIKGSHLGQLTKEILILTGFALFFNIWAVLSYHKSS